MRESTAGAAVFQVVKGFCDSGPGLVRLNVEHHTTGALEPIRAERVEDGERLMPRRDPQAYGRLFWAECPAMRGAVRPGGGAGLDTRAIPAPMVSAGSLTTGIPASSGGGDGCGTQIHSKTAVK